MRTILKKYDKKKCYFYQENTCLLSRCNCILCNKYIKKISGVDDPDKYLNFVVTKSLNHRNFWFAFFAFLFSLLTLLIKIIELITSNTE